MSIEKLIALLTEVEAHLTHEKNSYRVTNDESELSVKISRVKNQAIADNDISAAQELMMDFGPTSLLQDISIDNGWGEEFLQLALQYDQIMGH